ncbi:ribonuclease P protein subunit p14-like [Ylistrum balloti]|uniref:ribonuclease P protein subunit p14-like n=1 Tax=Ylistrum balloti TaxID=509963 RepID=UPI002905B6E4|nr:ribonuclease P protein subunit p14-like [Ylistrum balloti]XP_060084417.1 ribonuclease P protein subunit p14-like [Ylistrum balloti]XP_060084418.1 ribonuclease P protein subunit p14-like [Ylistrum balloti]XP_060084419.1 ribonuclease P protein subunit p14-like [Ylistrum balloti]XP_060084420.1 ribonuclease P protein subunit p14-like [Ylistrum balloti]
MTTYKRIVTKGPLPYCYLKIRLEFEDPSVTKSLTVNATTLKHAIVTSMKGLFGELGSSESIDILKFDEENYEAIIRTRHSFFVKVWSSLCLCGSFGGYTCAFRVNQVSAHLMGLACNSREDFVT